MCFTGTTQSSPGQGYQELSDQIRYGSENWDEEEEKDVASPLELKQDSCELNQRLVNAQNKVNQVRFVPPQYYTIAWGRGGSIGRMSASRSNVFHDQRFESHPERKTNL